MITNFIKNYLELIVTQPNNLEIKRVHIKDSFYEINIYASEVDIGKIIGKNGNMISSIKNIISACKAKDSMNTYKIQVISKDKKNGK